MDKEQELLFTVNGFIFGSQQDAELAQQELNTARYIEKKIENKSPATMLAIYKASIDKKMFRTPVAIARFFWEALPSTPPAEYMS